MTADLCEFERRGSRIACPRCEQPTLSGALPLPIRRVCRPKPDAPPPLSRNDLSLGPCVHRGALVAIERCQIGCQREKQIETFLCLPDAGCHGAAPVVSELQHSHAQTLNRRREVCGWCVRYSPRPRGEG